MALSEVQKALLEAEVREAYETYQRVKARIANEVRVRVEREIAAQQGDALRDLAKTLHDYHRKGLPKSRLRVATKKYGNQDEFLKLWNAYTPDDAFTLQPGRNPDPKFRLFEDESGKWFVTAFESPEGKKFDEPFTLGIEVAVKESVKKGGALWVDTEWDRGEARTADWVGMKTTIGEMFPFMNSEVERALLAGEIPEIIGASEQFARDYNN